MLRCVVFAIELCQRLWGRPANATQGFSSQKALDNIANRKSRVKGVTLGAFNDGNFPLKTTTSLFGAAHLVNCFKIYAEAIYWRCERRQRTSVTMDTMRCKDVFVGWGSTPAMWMTSAYRERLKKSQRQLYTETISILEVTNNMIGHKGP